MPKLNGLELREKLKTDADSAIKCIPYLFISTSLRQKVVTDAYCMSAHDFLQKIIYFQNWKRPFHSSWNIGKGVLRQITFQPELN